jgi:biotin synthase-like enzyme
MLGFKSKKDKKLKQEAERQRAIVRDVIWPIFLANAKNVKDAGNICKAFVLGMDTVFQMEMKKHMEERSKEPLETLKLDEFMTTGDAYQTEWKLLETLKNESIATSKGLIEGMGKELERLVDVELLDRPLDSLKTEWL